MKDANGEELISHCVVSTYEYYEYKVLNERIGGDVRDVIPPTEADVRYDNGKVSNADALSEDFINNPIIRQYIDDPKCAVILYENPPYRDMVADNIENTVKKIKGSYVFEQMKKELSSLPNSNISTARDLTNQFIWSAQKYYMRQKMDAYILFSPIKYWKTLGLADLHFEQGYLFNRKHFHATASAISCILWTNVFENNESLSFQALDIVDDELKDCGTICVKKAVETFLPLFDKRTFSTDTDTNVYCESSGEEINGRKVSGRSLFNTNIIGYLRPDSFSFGPKHIYLLRQMYYGSRGFYLRTDTYLSKLPLFVAKQIPLDNWYEKEVYATSSDGGEAYAKDKDFLKSCLIYTCLSYYNKCLSFDGSDGRHYRNELCFDGKTIATADLDKMELDDDEKMLMDVWNSILTEANKTGKCQQNNTYGVYQITKEINTFHKEGSGKNQKTVYDYPTLNGELNTLKALLKEYYKSHITDKMFQYQLLK